MHTSLDNGGKTIAQHIGNRSYNDKGQRNKEQQIQHRNKDAAQHLGNDPVQQLFQLSLHKTSGNDGKNRTGIADHVDRDAKEINCDGVGCAEQSGDIGVYQRRSDCHRDKRLSAELAACTVCKEDRQEVEHAVTGCVQDRISRSGLVQHTQRDEQDHKAFQQTGTGKGTQERGENAGNRVDQYSRQLLLFRRGGIGSRFCSRSLCHTCFGDVGGFQDNIIHISHIGANDDLILTGGFHDLEYAVQFFDFFGLCQRNIFQFETQTCNAMCQRDNVFFTADQLDNAFGKHVVIFCHGSPPNAFLVFSCFHNDPAAGAHCFEILKIGYHFLKRYGRIKYNKIELFTVLN